MEDLENKAEKEHNKAEQVKASVAAPLHPEATTSKAPPKKVKMKRVKDTVKPSKPKQKLKPKVKKAIKSAAKKVAKKLLKKAKPKKVKTKAKLKKPAKKKAFKRSKSKPSRKASGKKISIEKKAAKKKKPARILMNFKVTPSEEKTLGLLAKRWAKNNKSAFARIAILKYKPQKEHFKAVSSQLGR